MAALPAYLPNVIDLCQLADVREYINSLKQTTATPDDNVLQRMITSASTSIQKFCVNNFAAQEYVENRNGRGQMGMRVKNTPIISVVSLTIDTYVVPPSPTPLTYGWVADDVRIYIRQSAGTGFSPDYFTNGFLNVAIDYWAGYETPGQSITSIVTPGTPTVFPTGIVPLELPTDLQEACIEYVYLMNRQRTRHGDESVIIGGQNLKYYLKSMTDNTQETIMRYKAVAYPLT